MPAGNRQLWTSRLVEAKINLGYKLFLAVAVAALMLTIGCAVLADPNPCDRTQAVRDALEEATSRDCDLITNDDLADVSSLTMGVPLPAGNLQLLTSQRGDIGDLKGRDFAGLDNLQTLYLSGNNLNELPAGVFDGLDNLQRLHLGGNNLSELPAGVFDGLGNLQTLGLSGNNLSELPPGVFDGLGNLQTLGLSGNNLSELPPGVFDGLDNLQTLYLSGNNLSELSPGVFDGLDRLQMLDLLNNPGGPFTITHPNPRLQGNGWTRR